MTRYALLAALAAISPLPLLAQDAPAPTETVTREKCDNVVATRAVAADLAQLVADAQCYARRMVSAANSQAYRLERAEEIARGLGAPVPAPAPTPEPEPTPAPEPQPAPPPITVLSPEPTGPHGVMQLPFVDDGLDIASLLRAVPVAPSGKPDVVGAFRFHCRPGAFRYIDMIVFPGDTTGKSHLHQFFGNTEIDENSTYESLRKSGDSTCVNALNRSGYWQPAMQQTLDDGTVQAVSADNINIYYKRRPASDPFFGETGTIPVDTPRGLRYIFGFPTTQPKFKIVDPRTWSNVTDWSKDMRAVLAKAQPGMFLDASVSSPPCWDGKNLDSPDHRSHMAYYVGGAEYNWRAQCPRSHPYEIPTFTLQANYTILATDAPQTWHFSSDNMNPGGKPGSTFHADWFGAWNDEVLARWHAGCIDELRSGSNMNLCDGSMAIESELYRSLKDVKWRVPLPEHPSEHRH